MEGLDLSEVRLPPDFSLQISLQEEEEEEEEE